MTKLLRTSLCAAFFAASVFCVGCDDGAIERIENRLDCRQICDRYADCVGGEDDVEACRESCRDKALENDDWEAKVGRCSDCVDNDNSCVEDAFKCTADCAGIVP